MWSVGGLVVSAALALSSLASADDKICGRVVSIQCTDPSVLTLVVEHAPSPVGVEVAASNAAREQVYGFLDQKVCARGHGFRRHNQRIIAIDGIDAIEIRRTAAPAPAPPGGAVRACAAGVIAPQPQPSQKAPPTPVEFFRRGDGAGWVIVEVVVSAGGTVTARRVAAQSDPVLGKAVLADVASWRFTPAQRDGGPISASLFLEFDYSVYFR